MELLNHYDVIHVGGHKGEEKYNGNVLWIEPNPYLNIKGDVLRVAITNKKGKAILKIVNNSMASTISEWDEMLNYHPEFSIEEEIEVDTITLNDLPTCDYMVIDIEGQEYNALNVANNLPNKILVELNFGRYKTSDGYKTIELMTKKGYSHSQPNIKHGWCDVMFLKQDKSK